MGVGVSIELNRECTGFDPVKEIGALADFTAFGFAGVSFVSESLCSEAEGMNGSKIVGKKLRQLTFGAICEVLVDMRRLFLGWFPYL
jgi:hypothetical protein